MIETATLSPEQFLVYVEHRATHERRALAEALTSLAEAQTIARDHRSAYERQADWLVVIGIGPTVLAEPRHLYVLRGAGVLSQATISAMHVEQAIAAYAGRYFVPIKDVSVVNFDGQLVGAFGINPGAVC